MTCRNQLMNEGKPYGRSSCDQCGSIVFGGTCTAGVEPKPGSDPKYYVPTKTGFASMSKYGVIYTDTIHHEGDERSRTNPGHGYPAYTESVQKLETFDNEEKLKAWIERNNSGYSSKTFKAIKYEELKVATEVVISLS
jgi:hypothetical protein